jgi:hypothetical protein
MSLFEKPSLITRIAIGKGIGAFVGLIGFMAVPYFLPEVDILIRWGILLWYTTVGAVVGMVGVFTWHPVLHLPMPWWFRSTIIGAWMNFVLVFFAYDVMAEMMMAVMGTAYSPFWFTLEGAIIGLLIGYFATRFGGEGPETTNVL